MATLLTDPALVAARKRLETDKSQAAVDAYNQALSQLKTTPAAGVITPSSQTKAVPVSPQPVTSQEPPASFEQTGKALLQAEYDKTKQTADLLDAGPVFQSVDDEFQQTIKRQREQRALQEAQLKEQQTAGEFAASRQRNAAEGAAEVAKGQLTGSREGFTSATSGLAAQQFKTASQQQIDRVIAAKDMANRAIEQARADLRYAEQSQNTDLAQKYRQRLDAATAQAKQIETEYLGATAAAAEAERAGKMAGLAEKKQEYENTVKGLDTLGKIFEQGSKMDVDQIASLAKTLGVPLDSATSLYQSSLATRSDTTLTQEEKALKNKAALEEVKQKQAGLFTDAARDANLIKSLRLKGDFETAKLLERRLGIDDLSYTTSIRAKQIENSMNLAKLQGKPVGAQEWADYGSTWREQVDIGDKPAAVISQSSKYDVINTGDGVRFNVVANQVLDNPRTGRDEGQCGAFVNDVLGTKLGNTFASKMAETDPSILMPTPGMGFVQETNLDTGHAGLIESVDYEKGVMNVVDANWREDGRVLRRTMPISAAAGFIRPRQAQEVKKSEAGAVKGGDPNQYQWANTIISNTFGGAEGGKAAARKQKELTAAIVSGNGKAAKNIAFNAVLEGVNATERAAFEDALTTTVAYDKLKGALNEFKAKGLETGLKGNTISEIYKNLTIAKPEEAVRLQTRLAQSFNAYRKAITGAGASTGELEKLAESMPTFNKNINDVETMVGLITEDAKELLDRKVNLYSKGAFDSYQEMQDKLNGLQSLSGDKSSMGAAKPNPSDLITSFIKNAFNTEDPAKNPFAYIDTSKSDDILKNFD